MTLSVPCQRTFGLFTPCHVFKKKDLTLCYTGLHKIFLMYWIVTLSTQLSKMKILFFRMAHQLQQQQCCAVVNIRFTVYNC